MYYCGMYNLDLAIESAPSMAWRGRMNCFELRSPFVAISTSHTIVADQASTAQIVTEPAGSLAMSLKPAAAIPISSLRPRIVG
jgi:hypothetical protein